MKKIEKHYELGEVFGTVGFFEKSVTCLTNRLKGRREYKQAVKDRVVAGLCAIQYLTYTNRADKLESGDIRIAMPILHRYNLKFIDYYKILMENNPKIFVMRKGINAVRRTTALGIHIKGAYSWEKIPKDSVYYKYIEEFVDCFYAYITKGEGSVPEAYKEYADNYYKYTIDMSIASQVCKEMHGVTFEEAKEQYEALTEYTLGHHIYKLRDAYNEYMMCKSFSEAEYNVHMAYGRMYSPFHNLPKEYRIAFRTQHGEKVQELLDIHGAFVKGALATAGLVAKETGNKEVAKKCMDAANSAVDPYAFACTEDVTRKKAKKAVLSYLFATHSQVVQREKMYAKIINSGKDVASVIAYTDSFLEFMDNHTEVYSMKQNELRKVLGDFYGNSIILDIMHVRCKTANFINGDGKGMDLRKYVSLVGRIKMALDTQHVMKCIKNTYGEDVLNAVQYMSQLFEESSVRNLDNEQKANKALCKDSKAQAYWRRDLRKGNVINVSILCQIAEGKAMFGDVLPMLKAETGCTKLVTLHDAIYAPVSVKTDLAKLRKYVDASYLNAIVTTFYHNVLVKKALTYRASKAA